LSEQPSRQEKPLKTNFDKTFGVDLTSQNVVETPLKTFKSTLQNINLLRLGKTIFIFRGF